MSFEHPERILAAILAVIGFAIAFRMLQRRRARQALTYSNLNFAYEALQPRRWPGALWFVALLVGFALIAAAFTGPRFTARVPMKNVTVMLCIDTSGSMRAKDLLPSRSEASKAAALAFINQAPPRTRIGIVTFATGASLLQPPSDDLDAVRSALDRLPPPDGATAMGDALALATQQLPKTGTRAIVLMTDGISNRGVDPVSAAKTASSAGIAIHTVGVGTSDSGQLIPGTNEPAGLDEDTLRSISAQAHGTYASAQDAGSLSAAFRRIAAVTVWEPKRVNGSAIVAVSGGILFVLAFLGGLAVGRVP
jgi:Ca-activated chloride channel homolog